MMRGPPPNVMGMSNTPFIAPSAQPGQPSQPPQQHLSLLGGNPNPNPPMNLLGAQQTANGPSSYQLQMQQMARVQGLPQRNPALMQQAHPGAGMNPGMQSNPNMVNGMAANQLQQMPFHTSMSHVRRPAPQGQVIPQQGMMGMHGQAAMVGMPGGLDPAMRARVAQMQQQQQIRQLQQQQQLHGQHPHPQGQPGQHPMPGPNGIPPEMMIGGRPGPSGGGFQIARAPSQPQPTSGIPQPPSLPQTHSGNMQPPFGSSMQQHPQHTMGASPHPIHSNAAPIIPNLTGGMPGNPGLPPNVVQNRTRMSTTPDYISGNFQNAQQMNSLIQRNPASMSGGGGPPFPFGSAPHSPNNVADLPSAMPGGQMGTPRTANQQAVITPAQALDISQGDNFSGAMGPPSIPARPPSQQRPPQFAMGSQQLPGVPPQPPMQRQLTPLARHQSPRQPDQLAMQGQRPPSQPQVHHTQSPRQAPQPPQQPQPHPQPPPRTPQQPPSQLSPQQQHLQQQMILQQQQQSQQPQQPQAGPSRTPRSAPNPLPGGVPPHARPGPPPSQAPQVPPVPTKPPTPVAGGQQQGPPAPRPGQAAPPVVGGAPPGAIAGTPQSLQMRQMQMMTPQQQQRYQMTQVITNPFFVGPGVLFLESFSGALEGKAYEMLSLEYWQNMVGEFFMPDSVFRFTLWKDSMKQEAKPFEIGTAILPRFFLVTTQSGVVNMRLSLQGAYETKYDGYQDILKIECIRASWTFQYSNGYIVNLRGAFTALIRIIPGMQEKSIWLPNKHPGFTMRIMSIAFDAETQEKSLLIDDILGTRMSDSPGMAADGDEERALNDPRLVIPNATIPVEPVNAFGIPQATMRCLELAESVTQMADLIQFSKEHDLGPREALVRYAQRLREKESVVPGPSDMFQNTSSSSTLFPGPSGDSHTPAHIVDSPAAINGTPRPRHATPHQPQASGSGSTPGPSVATPAAAPTPTTMTPAMAPATLKRKNPGGAADAVSPTTSNSEPKRTAARKRTRTQNGL